MMMIILKVYKILNRLVIQFNRLKVLLHVFFVNSKQLNLSQLNILTNAKKWYQVKTKMKSLILKESILQLKKLKTKKLNIQVVINTHINLNKVVLKRRHSLIG